MKATDSGVNRKFPFRVFLRGVLSSHTYDLTSTITYRFPATLHSSQRSTISNFNHIAALVKEFSGHGPILGETSHPRAPKVQPQRQPTPLASCGSENPYVQRAYQIGPIPCGLGNIHLANHLSPPGWNIGDPLIHPQQAFKLYLFSAGEHLNFPKLGLIKNTHQERACRWKCHLQRVLLYERIEVFERNQIHQHTSHLFNENELEKTAEIQAMQLSELGIPWARDFPKNVIPSAPKTFGGQTASVVEQRSLRIQTGK